MFFLLVRKELLEQLLSLRFAMASIICLVVVLSSTWVLTKDYKEAQADYRTNIVLHKNQIEESNDLVDNGIKIDKPLNPMQIFFKGLNPELTATATVNSQSEPHFEADYEGNPVIFLFPPIDLLFFIGVVMSLLAIAFSYDAISGEKELGTLKLLMSYSVPRDLVLLAKWIGGYIALIAPFLVSV
ncbi:MAG: ABC transporter permease subunit, partial [Gemmatimonadetes bacterium]|nr:ABC transporter permease subunit [Gemmatimonadota bacterium]